MFLVYFSALAALLRNTKKPEINPTIKPMMNDVIIIGLVCMLFAYRQTTFDLNPTVCRLSHLYTLLISSSVPFDLSLLAFILIIATLPGTYPLSGTIRSRLGDVLPCRLDPYVSLIPSTGHLVTSLISSAVIENGMPSLLALCLAKVRSVFSG